MRIAVLFLFTFLCITFYGKSNATIDLSNVDLSKFQYFKDKVEAKMMAKAQQTMMLLEPIQMKITDKLEKAQAVAKYFSNVLFGNPDHEKEQYIYFDPHHGEHWRPVYERRYGVRGARLIDALGKGYSPEQVREYSDNQYGHPGY